MTKEKFFNIRANLIIPMCVKYAIMMVLYFFGSMLLLGSMLSTLLLGIKQ